MAAMPVEMYSDNNRTEPVGSWDPLLGLRTVPDIETQLGRDRSNERAGSGASTLHLKHRDSWIIAPDDARAITVPPLRLLAVNMNGQSSSTVSDTGAPVIGNLSLNLRADSLDAYRYQRTVHITSYDPIVAIEHHAALFDQFLTSSGSLAEALSSTITVLSSMAYYDQMPRFEQSSTSTQVHFATVLFPRSHLGYLIVLILVASHILIVSATTILFVQRTKHTLLGNCWQSLAQINTPEIRYMVKGSMKDTDKQIKARVRREGLQHATFAFPITSGTDHERARLVGA